MSKFKVGDYIINQCKCSFTICKKTRNKIHKIIKIEDNAVIINDPDVGLWGVSHADAIPANSYKIKEKLGIK